MWHSLVGDESAFFESLLNMDEQLASEVKRHGCPCGGRLDRADYPRKVRGVAKSCEDFFRTRISFCCAREGCRKRITPPSVRFLGRRVYVAAVMLVVCGFCKTARQAQVPKDTARRWRRHFESEFIASRFFKRARSRLMPPVDERQVIASLLKRFGHKEGNNAAKALRGLLLFICPVTTTSAPEMMAVM